MDRRTAIKYTSLMTGVTLSSAFVTGFLSGCKPSKEEIIYKPLLLDEDQFIMLKNLSNVIIPTTDTPGAVELGVPELLETIIAKCYTEKDQKKIVNDLSLIAEILNDPIIFNEQKVEHQKKKVKDLEEGLAGKYSAIKPAYHSLKGSIAASFLSTEYVGKNLLEYLPVPGQYEGCIPLSSTSGKAYTI
jgi:hypothetical protein